MIEGISVSSVDIPSRKSLALYLEKACELMMAKLKKKILEVSKVSTTADFWTLHNRSYLGMTVHWIDEIYVKLHLHASVLLTITLMMC